MRSHPFDTALLTVRKLFRFWLRIFLPDNRWAQSYIVLFQTFFLGVAVLGMLEAKRQGITVFPLILPVVFLAAVHALTFPPFIQHSDHSGLEHSAGGLRAIAPLNERWGLSLGVSWVRWLRAVPVGAAARSYRETRL
jgi:hypothetical protein